MPKSPNQKLKLLVLMNYLMEETDEQNAVSLAQLQEELERCGISAERKSVYDDLDALRRWGLDVKFERGRGYFIASREFELPELKLLVDSVQAAKFITDKKSRELIRKLEGLVSTHQARQLHRQVLISGRVKTMNESIYYNIDKLHMAINSDSQIRFQYYQWNVKKEMELRHGGAWYQVSPWALIWDDENYYLVAFDSADAKIKHYRVDKMLRIKALDEPRLGRDTFRAFDMARYAKTLFGMYGGEEADVTLVGEARLAGVVIDRFGKDIPLVPVEGDKFEAKVRVAVSPQFFGWVMGMGGGLQITGPGPVVKRMREEVKKLAEQYLNI